MKLLCIFTHTHSPEGWIGIPVITEEKGHYACVVWRSSVL